MKFSGFRIEFSDKNVTANGGMILMKELMERTGLLTQLSKENLPLSTSPNSYTSLEIVQGFFISIWCGASNFLNTERIRFDETLKTMFGMLRLPSHVTYGRFFKKFSWARNNSVFPSIQKWWFSQLEIPVVTLDFDSTVMTRYGTQEGAKKGYNPQKKGRASHHPLLAIVSEVRMIANAWMRSGNTSSASSFEHFLSETLGVMGDKKVGLVRADSGFCSNQILRSLENRNLPYVIAMPMYGPLQLAIKQIKNWAVVDKGIWLGEFFYQAYKWESSRRIVVVKQHIALRPKAGGKVLKLFADEEAYSHDRYHAFVTNQPLPAEQIWSQYRGRGDAENRIKEIKDDFFAAGFTMREFFATEAAFRTALIAYNMVSLFRQTILRSPVQHRLPHIRFNCFTVGAWMVKKGSQVILKMALAAKNRKWMVGLFSNYEDLTMPIAFKT